MHNTRLGVASFIVKHGWLIGVIALITAGILYSISIQSLSYGLGHVDEMANAVDTSLLFAWAINLLEIIGVCWLLAAELRFAEEQEIDQTLNSVINIALIVILVGDFAAILYASGSFSNLPGDIFGMILAGLLRIIKSFVGAAGSELCILVGIYLISEWFKEYRSKNGSPRSTRASSTSTRPTITRPAPSGSPAFRGEHSNE